MKRTYLSWIDPGFYSRQREYTEPRALLSPEGRLLTSGWARENLFKYDRTLVRHPYRRKEWDFYQISDGHYMAQVSFANISLGGYASAVLVDLREGKTLCSVMAPFLGGKDKYVLPPRGDLPGSYEMQVGKALFAVETRETERILSFRIGQVECVFTMDIPRGLENITTVLPFRKLEDRYFMTTKQNCMATAGTFRYDGGQVEFTPDRAFAVLDWGRVCTPYRLVWYWGNGSGRVMGPDGQEHLFGFELTWGIGAEPDATETCLFWDGKAHKVGPVDVEEFPKPDKYTQPWHIISQDGRVDLTMKPFYDHHSDLNVLVMRMHSHQVHGLWSGFVTLDDGTKVEIKDLYAFCEYVENRW